METLRIPSDIIDQINCKLGGKEKEVFNEILNGFIKHCEAERKNSLSQSKEWHEMFNTNTPHEALQLANDIVHENNWSAEAHYLKGVAILHCIEDKSTANESISDVIDCMRHAIALDEYNKKYYSVLSSLYRKIENYKGSIDCGINIIEIAPFDSEGYRIAAHEYIYLGEYVKAYDICERYRNKLGWLDGKIVVLQTIASFCSMKYEKSTQLIEMSALDDAAKEAIKYIICQGSFKPVVDEIQDMALQLRLSDKDGKYSRSEQNYLNLLTDFATFMIDALNTNRQHGIVAREDSIRLNEYLIELLMKEQMSLEYIENRD